MKQQQKQMTHKTDVNAALLTLTHGRCIYEKARMSGEQRHRLHLLPVDTLAEKTDCCSDATDTLYANSLTSILPHDESKHHSIYDNTRMSGEQVRRHELPVNRLAERRDLSSDATDHAYLRSLRNDDVFAHEITNHSIYDSTRMSGEQRHPHPLPVNVAAERSDRCTDADDSKYLNCLTNMFMTSKASRLCTGLACRGAARQRDSPPHDALGPTIHPSLPIHRSLRSMKPGYVPVAPFEVDPPSGMRGMFTRQRVLWGVVLLVVAAATFVAMLHFAHTQAFMDMVDWIQYHRFIGAGLYVFSFMVFIMLCFPSTGFELLAGYTFGFWLGLLLSTTGKLLGSVASFIIGRYLCRARVLEFMDRAHPAWRAFRSLVRKKQVLIVFLTRIAFFPIAIKNYGLSVLDVSFVVYVSAALTTGLPFSVLWVYSGNSAEYLTSLLSEGHGHNTTKAIVLIVGASSAMLLLVIIGYSTRKHVLKLAKEEEEMAKQTDEENGTELVPISSTRAESTSV